MAKTLANIRSKVRQLSARKSEAELSTAEIDFQINSYYQTEFPQQLRLLDLRQKYTFQTVPNQDVYNFPPDQIQSIEPPVFVAGYQVYFTMDKPQWKVLWSQLQTNEVSTQGNGTDGPYTFTTQSQPIQKTSYIVSASNTAQTAQSLIDDGNGNLVIPSDLNAAVPVIRGTIDYITGAVSITNWPVAVTLGVDIVSQYVLYNASRPTTAFYYSNQLTLYPIPDQVYTVEMTAYVIPTALLSSVDSPHFAVGGPEPSDQNISEWWEALAYGAAMKIYENNMDLEASSAMEQLLERKLNLIRRRTWYQLGSQRTATIYAGPMGNTYAGYPYPGFFVGY